METGFTWLLALLKAIPAFFLNPFTYLLFILLFLHWKRQVEMERKLFSVRLLTVGEGMLQSVLYGTLGGLLISLVFVGVGIVFSVELFLYLWTIAVLLLLFHVRYFCFAYSGGILAAIVLVVRFFPQGKEIAWLAPWWHSLESLYLPSIFLLVALLHLAESLLVRLSAEKGATPIFIQSKRGKLVGAYHVQHIWFVPLFLLVPFQNGQAVPALFAGWPLFTAESAGMVSLLLLPAVLGYSDQAVSLFVQDKTKRAARYLLIYSLILLALAVASEYLSLWLIIPTLLFSIVGHELIFWLGARAEKRGSPIFAHPPEGLKILAVIPDSPAAKMNLQAGEVIVKVNGQKVHRRKELYEALLSNMTFCKLEVLNLEGNLKFTQSSIYQEDHHQLGVILAPDQESPFYLEATHSSLWKLLSQRINRKSNQRSIQG